MKKAWFKKFVKPSKGNYLIAAISATELQGFAEDNFGRQLTEKELEAVCCAFAEDCYSERCDWMHEAITQGLKNCIATSVSPIRSK